MKKFKCFWKELGNVLTNVLVPVVAMVAAIMELLQLPTAWIQGVKKVEYWLWEACGTKKEIDKFIEKVEVMLDDVLEEE